MPLIDQGMGGGGSQDRATIGLFRFGVNRTVVGRRPSRLSQSSLANFGVRLGVRSVAKPVGR